jgi:hypothetical protein
VEKIAMNRGLKRLAIEAVKREAARVGNALTLQSFNALTNP